MRANEPNHIQDPQKRIPCLTLALLALTTDKNVSLFYGKELIFELWLDIQIKLG